MDLLLDRSRRLATRDELMAFATIEATTQDMFRRALELDRQGDVLGAEAACERLLEHEPKHVPALQFLGMLALRTGRPQVAIERLERATAVSSRPELSVVLAEAYRLIRRLDEAALVLERSLLLDPGWAPSHYALGLVEADRGANERAVSSFARAVSLAPRVATFHSSLGRARAALGEHERAAQHFKDGLALEPDNAAAHKDLGAALRALHREEESVLCYERALELNGGSSRGHFDLYDALTAVGAFDDALRVFRRGAALDPDNADAGSDLVFLLPFRDGHDDALVDREARAWNARYAAHLTAAAPAHSSAGRHRDRLRVGYVSADFRRHVQALYMLPLLEQHDRGAFEIFAYSSAAVPDDATMLHRELVDEFRDISGLSDEAAAQLIRADQIDILVDLTMHMSGGRLLIFARRPAPVQVTWLAYPGTTGLDAIDYRLTDPNIEPPGLTAPSAEQPWRLPETFWCFMPWHASDDAELEVGPLPALARGHVTFGCLNAFSKSNDATFVLWARVLAAVEGSRLLILVPPGGPRRRVSARFERAGIDPARIEFVDFQSPRSAYLSTYQRIDIALDTLPYNGHTTSLDAFYMGVPVLSLVGNTVVGRAGLCYARNLDLSQWAVFDADAYVETASAFARDWAGLSRLRAELRSRFKRSPLMDSSRFVRHLEGAYREMWQRWIDERAPPPP